MDTLSPGTKLGRYEIRSKIGAGGMGEVYLAQDTKLDRKVALKILPAELAANHDRMRRFVQEAKAASALNHPSIITIHEIDEIDSINFIATEFIDGETLRERMSQPMKLAEVLDVAVQVAGALSAAHAAGIVHRDIKPENIMSRRDGIVKVLDFGLAKLAEVSTPAIDAEAATKPLFQTQPGSLMGTLAYMSPEQVRGLNLDARTDIWSLGVVLYEMLAGQSPFAGETSSHIGFAILETEPAPIAQHAPQSPAELRRIVRKTLAKDRDVRYQTVRDLLIDLKNLHRELDLQSEIERSRTPSGEMPKTIEAKTVPEKRIESSTHLSGSTASRPESSAAYLISKIKHHKTVAFIATTTLVAVIFVGIFGLYNLVSRKRADQGTNQTGKPAPGQDMKIQRLTADGKVESAAISPDGKYVTYVVKDGTQQSLWMRLVATNSRMQITAPAGVTYGEQTFSPDGTFIYYIATDKNNPNGALYQVPVLGGATRKILVNIGSPITFSPDGNRFAFVRNDEASSREDQLIVANADGTDQRKLAARKDDSWFWYGGPAWSPDGKVIACGGGSYLGGWHWLVIAVEVETGEQKEFTNQRWFRVGRVAWLTDGTGLVVSAADQGSTFYQIWQLSYPRGEARRITNDLNDYGGISLTADSKAFVAVQKEWISNIWIAPGGDGNRAKQITFGKQLEGSVPDLFGITLGLAWTPDGRIVYTSMASGNLDLWIMNHDATEQKQLTTDPAVDWMPAVSADGRYIVFISHRSIFPSLWRMDIDGGNLKQLDDKEDYAPQISADSRWIFFQSLREGKLGELWKMPIDGGAPVKPADKIPLGPIISPDGKLFASLSKDEQLDSLWKIVVTPFEGGVAIKTFDVPQTIDGGVDWTPDSRAITYIDTRGVPNLWSQPYDGGPPKPLTDFKDQGVWQRAWSNDGKWLALARGTVTRDVVLIKDFR